MVKVAAPWPLIVYFLTLLLEPLCPWGLLEASRPLWRELKTWARSAPFHLRWCSCVHCCLLPSILMAISSNFIVLSSVSIAISWSFIDCLLQLHWRLVFLHWSSLHFHQFYCNSINCYCCFFGYSCYIIDFYRCVIDVYRCFIICIVISWMFIAV